MGAAKERRGKKPDEERERERGRKIERGREIAREAEEDEEGRRRRWEESVVLTFEHVGKVSRRQ